MSIQRPPLTKSQQETVLKWRPLALKYTRRLLFGYGLRDFEDEIPSLAADALMEAIRVWGPERAGFHTCLRWWVRRVLQGFRAHGARVVHQSMDTDPKDFVTAFSLNQYTGPTEAQETWLDLLEDESTRSVGDEMDARRLYLAAKDEIPARIIGRRGAHVSPKARKAAVAGFGLWHARVLEGHTYEELAAPLGLSRQAIQHRISRVHEAFEKWAREIREEAA